MGMRRNMQTAYKNKDIVRHVDTITHTHGSETLSKLMEIFNPTLKCILNYHICYSYVYFHIIIVNKIFFKICGIQIKENDNWLTIIQNVNARKGDSSC